MAKNTIDRNTLTGRDLISIKDLSAEEIHAIIAMATRLKTSPDPTLLKGKLLGSCFFEPSTRTRISFEAAMLRMGGQVVGFSDANGTSLQKGESLQDTMRMMDAYTDIVAIRHHRDGAARLAADTIDIPVINAGDGRNEHPTQTLLDLFTIGECQGRLHELNIALVGDLKHGRTVHSLALASIHFGNRLYLVSPTNLEMPPQICRDLSEKGIRFSMHRSIEEIIHKIDILYMTRVQKERIGDKAEYEAARNSYCLTPHLLTKAKETMRVLHPLPRVHEINPDVDDTPFAYYFQQAANGLYVRQALLALLLTEL